MTRGRNRPSPRANHGLLNNDVPRIADRPIATSNHSAPTMPIAAQAPSPMLAVLRSGRFQ